MSDRAGAALLALSAMHDMKQLLAWLHLRCSWCTCEARWRHASERLLVVMQNSVASFFPKYYNKMQRKKTILYIIYTLQLHRFLHVHAIAISYR
jgi:hypothetical protein